MEMSRQAQLAMATIAASAIGHVQVPADDNTDWQGTKNARVVGWDNGKPSLKPQPRNAACECGSGRKAKKCCRFFGVKRLTDGSVLVQQIADSAVKET